jgi:hypothetical protein
VFNFVALSDMDNFLLKLYPDVLEISFVATTRNILVRFLNYDTQDIYATMFLVP